MRLYLSHLLLGFLFLAACEIHFVVYEIPNDYVGWVVVEYSGEECDVEQDQRLGEVIRVDENGRGCSHLSDSPPTELREAHYVDRFGNRVRELSVDPRSGELGFYAEHPAPLPEDSARIFFVGTQEQFEVIKNDPWPRRFSQPKPNQAE